MTSFIRQNLSRLAVPIAGAAIIIAPLLMLFKFHYFYVDWANNLWLIEYMKRYLLANHAFPSAINTKDGLVGMVNPMFYGYLYYPLMGMAAIVVGSARRAVILTQLLQEGLIFSIYGGLFRGVFRRGQYHVQFLTLAFTAIVMWNTYLITKLYGDGGRGEYYAMLCLYLAIGSWIMALRTTSVHRLFYITLSMLNALLILGAHPITAEIGGILYVVIVFVTIPGLIRTTVHKAGLLFYGGILAAGMVASILPWVRTVIDNAGSTYVSTDKIMWFTPTGLKGMLYRIALYPYSHKSIYHGRNAIAPYLCLQVNVPLLLICLATLCMVLYYRKHFSRREKAANAGLLALAFLMYLFSSCSWIKSVTEKIFYSIQFEYRLITYVDLLMLAATVYQIYLLLKIRRTRMKKALLVIFAAALLMSAENVFISESYAYALGDFSQADLSSNVAPGSFYWRNDYANAGIAVIEMTERRMDVSLPLDENILEPESVAFHCSANTIVDTNISSSDYNSVYLDGSEIPKDQLFRKDADSYTYSFTVSEGGEHTLEYRSNASARYVEARKMAVIFSAGMIILTLGLGIASVVARQKEQPDISI